jgi:hypothetical protein
MNLIYQENLKAGKYMNNLLNGVLSKSESPIKCARAFEILHDETFRMLKRRAWQQKRPFLQVKEEYEELVKRDAMRLRNIK